MKSTKFKTALILVLTLVSLVPLGIIASADGNENPEPVLIVTKNLQMNEGTTTPAAEFDFQLQFVDASPALAATDYLSGLENGDWVTRSSIEFTEAMIPASHPTIANAVLLSATTDDDLLAGIIWPSAGVYTFRLRELANTTTLPLGETMIYDHSIYYVVVAVHTDAEGNRFVAGVYVMSAPPTVDYETGAITSEYKTYPVFTNTFVRDDADLTVSKTVAGDMGNQTTPFEFTGTLTSAPFSAPLDVPYPVVAVSNSSYTATIVGAGPGEGDVITFISGEPTTFLLAHGQSLVFDSPLPVGTNFIFSELNPGAYTPTLELIVNGNEVVVENPTLTTGNRRVGEDANFAAFTNTFDSVPITGLVLNNISLILVGFAAAGFITMVIIGKKREAAHD